MLAHSEVLSDVAELRSQLRIHGSAHRDLLRLSLARPLLDIAFDWLVIIAAAGAVVWVSHWLAPVAVVAIANRQRALGNILHDAGHRNLCRNQSINDAVAHVLLAPCVFVSLATYRATHFRHHHLLGDRVRDPDFLPIPDVASPRWQASFIDIAGSWQTWLGSFAGHLASSEVPRSSKLAIVLWWSFVLVAVDALAAGEFTLTFASLWLVARATLFHLITTFREMCDHYGLQPGGIFSFTRDMVCDGFWRHLVHPRNNGYHLTHHLLPAVPYYRLPEAHRLFQKMPAYRARAQVCSAYFARAGAVTRCWQAGSLA